MKKAALSVFMVLCMLLCIVPASAGEAEADGSFTMLNINVAGLPDFNHLLGLADSTDVKAKEKVFGAEIEKTGIDFIAVQEDFNYHKALSETMTSYKYKTDHSGSVPFGDGLNFFSKTPIYNTEREEWRTRYGIFHEGDELTPKGILYSVIEIADGVYADFYNIHADAFDTEESKNARLDNYKQLIEMIEKHNSDRPIIITGDFNISFHFAGSDVSADALKELFVDDLGFKEAWIELKNAGNYTDFMQWYQCGVDYWGNWDSFERFFYKDGNGIHLEPTECEYVTFTDGENNRLSDHNGCYVKFEYTLGESFKAESKDNFKVKHLNPISEFVRKFVYFFKTLGKCLANLDELKEVISGN